MSSTRSLWRRYSPFIDAVNDSLSGFSIHIESALEPLTYERKLSAGAFDIILVEPHRVFEIERRNYRVFARAGREDGIEGIIVVRAGVRIEKPSDLKGKVLCFGAANALASTLLPRMWLREEGFSERTAEIVFTGSDDTALFYVWRGLAAAAAVSAVTWSRFLIDHPEAAPSLKPLGRTSKLSGIAIMAHRRVPAGHIRKLETVLTRLDQTVIGRRALSALGLTSLRAADEASYDDVWEFLASYARVFGNRTPGVPR
jgi:ABC-type phosphate/phosphonate transport system, periplasmic component